MPIAVVGIDLGKSACSVVGPGRDGWAEPLRSSQPEPAPPQPFPTNAPTRPVEPASPRMAPTRSSSLSSFR
jgi:hypothetical protein